VRSLRLAFPAVPLLVLLAALCAAMLAPPAAQAAPVTTGFPVPKATTYTVTKTFGPFDGTAKIGESGSVPDGEAIEVTCRNPRRDSILSGAATINRSTPKGTARHEVLKFDSIGAFYDTEDDTLNWGGFVYPRYKDHGTRGPIWNSVTLTITCRS
jgi:hypothetical protein